MSCYNVQKRTTRIPRRSQRQGPPRGGKGAPWKRPPQRNGYRGPPSKPSQQPPTRKPLTNLNENGANVVKPARGRGIGHAQKTAHDVPPRFRKKSTEDQFTNGDYLSVCVLCWWRGNNGGGEEGGVSRILVARREGVCY